MRKKISDGFCVLPFYGIEYPSKIPCCIMESNHDLAQVRKEMLENKKPKACSACWFLESKNLISDRQLKNSSLDFYWDRDIRAIEDDCHQGKFSINHYKIDVSNICNAACLTCNSTLSSYWGSLEKNFILKEMSKEKLDELIDYETALVINFRGGESLLAKNCFYVLEKLLETGNTRCNLQFTTNGSVDLNKHQIALLERFQNINFGVSIDGTHAVFEYMRYPLTWDHLEENIQRLRKITPSVSICPTISNINLMYFSDLIAWFEYNKFDYYYNLVTSPSYFKPSALPKNVKLKILEEYTVHDSIRSILQVPHDETDDLNFTKALAEIARQDELKKIDIRNYLPEFCKLIGI